VHPGDLAGGFFDLEMTWLLYCAGAATGKEQFLAYLTEQYNCVCLCVNPGGINHYRCTYSVRVGRKRMERRSRSFEYKAERRS